MKLRFKKQVIVGGFICVGFHLDIFGYGNIPLEDLIDLNALDKFVESCGKQNS